ncbi:MAG: ABC transporter ATP-binding protein [Lentisphaeria bacterium]
MLRCYLNYYKPYKFLFWADMFCALIVSFVDLVFPQILRILKDQNLLTSSPEVILSLIIKITLGLLGLYVVRFFAQYFITSWGHIMGARMETDMRQDLFEHYQKLSFSYYDKNNTGEMMSKLVADLFDITELSHHGPEMLVISTLTLIGSFVILFTINIQMTLVLMSVAIVMILFSWRQNRKMRKIFLDNRRKIATVNARVQDSLAGVRVVQSFGNEDIEQDKFDYSNRAFLDSKEKNYHIMGIFHAGNDFFQGLLYISILLYGGFYISRGKLALSELAIYALYIGIFIHPIQMLVQFTELFQRGWSGFRRFYAVIRTDPEIVDSKDAVDAKDGEGKIQFKNVCFSYHKDLSIIHDVSFDIPAGKTVALVGPSGGGKTTLCSLLPRFYDINSGEITIDDVDIRMIKIKSLRRKIGIVQQDVYMFTGTIKENILYGKPDASDDEVIAAAKRANIHDDIMEFTDGYDTTVGERGVRLSGGQKQRISIARVFLKNPPVLILDEATSALDNESERHIQAALNELSSGRTSLVIAHRLSTIRFADEIIVIEDGKIKERGNHEELLKVNGTYAKYYQLQMQ